MVGPAWHRVLTERSMKKFNIRKVLDGLTNVSSATPSQPLGVRENDLIHETLQSEHFQLCKVVYSKSRTERDVDLGEGE